MDYAAFKRLTREEQNACLDAFMAVLFGDKANEATKHLAECAECREMYAVKFADFMTETNLN